MVDSSSNEDELNRLLDQISNIITTFKTLSREQAEIAILEGTSKLKNCESILSQIEQDLEDNKNNHSPEELLEEKKNLKTYKNELNDLSNKFKNIQDNYISKKTQNALIDDEPKISSEENIENEENKSDNEGKSKDKMDNNISFNNKIPNGFENNIGNISDVKNSRNITDDAFDSLNNKKSSKKKCLIIGVIIFFIVIFLFVVILGVQSNKK